MNLPFEIGIFIVVAAVYIVAVSLWAFAAFGADKKRAESGEWRISERKLIVLALLGGSLGAFIGMRKFHHKTKKLKFRVVVPLLLVLQLVTLALLVGSLIYFSDYYHADSNAEAALNSSEDVTVKETNDFYYFDGPGSDKAFVFYPGAKVEASAYAPLMKQISSKGVDCFIVKMPLNFALLGTDKAKAVQQQYKYKSWIIGGHSLGGVAASSYASNAENGIAGVVLLSSYSTEDLHQEKLKALAIYGSNDCVLNTEAFEDNLPNLPDDSKVIKIDGANHAQFGNYGPQDGDGEAAISSAKQQRLTAKAVVELASKVD